MSVVTPHARRLGRLQSCTLGLLRFRCFVSVITLVEILRGLEDDKRSKLKELLEESFIVDELDNATIQAYCNLTADSVKDPERYGVAILDESGTLTGIEEKPQHPKSNYAITGLYLYDNSAVEMRVSATSKPGVSSKLLSNLEI